MYDQISKPLDKIQQNILEKREIGRKLVNNFSDIHYNHIMDPSYDKKDFFSGIDYNKLRHKACN